MNTSNMMDVMDSMKILNLFGFLFAIFLFLLNILIIIAGFGLSFFTGKKKVLTVLFIVLFMPMLAGAKDISLTWDNVNTGPVKGYEILFYQPGTVNPQTKSPVYNITIQDGQALHLPVSLKESYDIYATCYNEEYTSDLSNRAEFLFVGYTPRPNNPPPQGQSKPEAPTGLSLISEGAKEIGFGFYKLFKGMVVWS